MNAKRKKEIASGIAKIIQICEQHDLVCEWNEAVDATWLEIWADGVDDLESLCGESGALA